MPEVHVPAGMMAKFEQLTRERDEARAALATAVARARREGLEEAARIAHARAEMCKAAAGEWLGPEDVDGTDPQMAACMSAAMDQCEQAAKEILALCATNPPEARQTETGWKLPAGWKLIPEEPTQEMWAAFRNSDQTQATFYRGYRAMLAASPPPAIGNQDGEGRS